MTENLITFRKFVESDYATICEWWDLWRFPKLPLIALPPTGVMTEVNGIPACSGFMYMTDSIMASLEWVVRNPKLTKAESEGVVEATVRQLIAITKADHPTKIISTCVRNEYLIKVFEIVGFTKSEEFVTNMLYTGI